MEVIITLTKTHTYDRFFILLVSHTIRRGFPKSSKAHT